MMRPSHFLLAMLASFLLGGFLSLVQHHVTASSSLSTNGAPPPALTLPTADEVKHLSRLNELFLEAQAKVRPLLLNSDRIDFGKIQVADMVLMPTSNAKIIVLPREVAFEQESLCFYMLCRACLFQAFARASDEYPPQIPRTFESYQTMWGFRHHFAKVLCVGWTLEKYGEKTDLSGLASEYFCCAVLDEDYIHATVIGDTATALRVATEVDCATLFYSNYSKQGQPVALPQHLGLHSDPWRKAVQAARDIAKVD